MRGRGRVCEVGRSDPCVSSAAVPSARVPRYRFTESLRTDCDHAGSKEVVEVPAREKALHCFKVRRLSASSMGPLDGPRSSDALYGISMSLEMYSARVAVPTFSFPSLVKVGNLILSVPDTREDQTNSYRPPYALHHTVRTIGASWDYLGRKSIESFVGIRSTDALSSHPGYHVHYRTLEVCFGIPSSM